MATTTAKRPKEFLFEWQGKNRKGQAARGEISASGENQARVLLRRQGVQVQKIKKQKTALRGKRIKPKDIALFTRQLATMMKAGVPLLQSFDIVGRGHSNPLVSQLLGQIRMQVETGTSLNEAFRKHPKYFDKLYCNLIEAGEQAGILDQVLDRLATYMEKMEAIKSKIKSALTYPIAVLTVAVVVVTIIMIFVVPSFKTVFSSFGAQLPAPTLMVIALSEFFVAYWWVMLLVLGLGGYFFMQAWKRSEAFQETMDRVVLRIPVFGDLIRKSIVARWTRTMSTMFAAGVPLVEALDSVGGAAGNIIYEKATERIQNEVATGNGLTYAMTDTKLFPNMVLQMTAIGEESGTLDHMLGKAADFYEAEVDDAVEGLSALMEPFIIVVLGTLIGGIVVAMYLPIFKLGQVV